MIDFESIFWSSWLHFDTQVGTMLATFSAQEGRRCEVQPCCLTRWRFSLIFRRLDPILASFWLHFGPPGPHLGSIWEVFGYMLAPFWRYVGPFERKSWHWMRWSGGATRSVKISVF